MTFTTKSGFRVPGLEEPIQDRLDLEWFERRPQGQNAGRNAAQMRGRPARRGLTGEGAEVAAALGLELDLIAQQIGEVQRIVEQSLVHRDQRRRERGGIAA